MSTTLDKMGSDELRAKARELNVDVPGALKNEDKLRELLRPHMAPKVEPTEQELAIRERVRIEEAERKVIAKREEEAITKLGLEIGDKKKCYEDIEIEKSPKRKYRFVNVECATEDVSFCLGTHRYHLFDGMEYELPEFVPKILQERCRLPIYKTVPDGEGGSTSKKVDDRPRFSFEDLGEVA